MLKKIMKKGKNNKGFTLVELLVVIAIIAILAVVAVPSLMKNINKAKVADIVADYSAIKSQVLATYADNALEDGIYTKAADGTGLTYTASNNTEHTIEVQDLSEEAEYSLEVESDEDSGDQTAELTITAKNSDIAKKVAEQINGDHTADTVTAKVQILK